jgi:ribosomal subunit interface protein
MKTHIHYKNLSEPSHPGLEKRVRGLARRHLERHLTHFSPGLVQLHVELEKNNRRALFQVELRLGMPDTALVSREQSDDLAAGLRQSFAELERQLERHLSQLRREQSWRRKKRREALRQIKTVNATQMER